MNEVYDPEKISVIINGKVVDGFYSSEDFNKIFLFENENPVKETEEVLKKIQSEKGK